MKRTKKAFQLLKTTAYGKSLIPAFIIFLLMAVLSLPVYADETQEGESDSAVFYTVTGIENSEQLANLLPFEMVRRSSQNTEPLFYHVYNNGLLTVNATIKDSEGNITNQTLPVSWSCWDNSTTITNTTVCGEYIETGTIQLPDASYTWGDGVLSELSLLVRVYDPTEPVEIVALEEVWNEFSTAFSLEQNSSMDDLLASSPLQTTWPCYDAMGNEYLCPVIYNTDAVIEDTVGIYEITATFEAPLNCRFSDSLTVPSYSMPVTVQALGQPRLDLSYISPNYEYILFPWITSGINLDTIEVWLSENDGEWRMLEPDDEVFIHSTVLDLYAWYLNEGSTYRIQVDYEGGQTGIASFTYGWDILSDKEYIEGDRDGGDTNGNAPITPPESSEPTAPEPSVPEVNVPTVPEPTVPEVNVPTVPEPTVPEVTVPTEPEVTEPEPTVPTEPASTEPEPAVPTEPEVTEPEPTVPTEPEVTEPEPTVPTEPESTEPEVAEPESTEPAVPTDPEPTEPETSEPYLLGSEMNTMLETSDTALFSNGSISLNIPADSIASLDLSSTDRILVTILPHGNNGFSVSIFKNDVAVTKVSTMQISLPYEPAKNTVPVLFSENGNKIASGDYVTETGLVTFTIHETGTFYIQDEAVPLQAAIADNTSPSMLIALVVTAIIFFAIIAILLITNKRKYIPYLLTLLAASGLCVSLYLWNNKYTHDGIQPSQGQLSVTEANLEKTSFLIRDWEFYPDQLLTPDTYPGERMVYTAIGDRTRFDGLGTRTSPHGYGSYALHINLPKDTQTYALELPEIYSAYRLYINGKLITSVGNPLPDSYTPATQAKIVTFEAGGQADILLAVSDYSHFYSGMVYPPAFGTFSEVNSLHNMRLAVTLIACTIGLLFSLFYIYFGINMKQKAPFLFAALCFIMFLTPLFPIIHSLWELPVFPWYALELICIYLIMFFVILLHNRLCDTGYYCRRISTAISAGFCLVAGCYGLFSAYLTVPVMQLYSRCLFIYKLAFAAYLLISAGLSLKRLNQIAKPLFFAEIAYAVVFIWDRILPTFEPIFFGWFMDWGSLMIVCAIGYTLWRDLTSVYMNKLAFEEENHQYKKQLAMQEVYQKELNGQLEERRRMTHDFRQQIYTISGFVEQLKNSSSKETSLTQLEKYLNSLTAHTTTHSNMITGAFSQNTAVDVLLQYYYFCAKEHNIHMDIRFCLPQSPILSDVELCTVLGNLLENAVDACNRMPDLAESDSQKRISLSSRETEGQWFVFVENTYDGIVQKKNNRFLSRKDANSKRFGIGLESVEDIAKKHNGILDIYPKETVFGVGITFNKKTASHA